MNYVVSEQGMLDIFYTVPFPFIQPKFSSYSYTVPKSVNETKVSKQQNMFLGIGNRNTLTMSYSLMNLIYWQEFVNHIKVKKLTPP
mmetsp:Transcript_30433/g.29807  ORF Transcript_30433/g.29807 Transcript_30433/m.29807 type:complete len:86 (-) Transcript_30433:2141-2398(-)